jgi:hypothetical protein
MGWIATERIINGPSLCVLTLVTQKLSGIVNVPVWMSEFIHNTIRDIFASVNRDVRDSIFVSSGGPGPALMGFTKLNEFEYIEEGVTSAQLITLHLPA